MHCKSATAGEGLRKQLRPLAVSEMVHLRVTNSKAKSAHISCLPTAPPGHDLELEQPVLVKGALRLQGSIHLEEHLELIQKFPSWLSGNKPD